MIYKKYGKRLIDFLLSFIGLIFLSPLFIIVAILIKLDDGGSIFFRQIRVGQNGKLFKIYKFRTMIENAEKLGFQVTRKDDPRITRLGRVLRKYKIDELPQLINVLRGEMSLVGPRPEVPKYVEIYKEEYEKILKIKPGITDYAAIEYIDEENVLKAADDSEKIYIEKILPEKIRFYQKYINDMSFFTDMKLIIKTLSGIIR
ncbi:sugar transferase [Thermodesulfovibrio yellowstonii]|uniref:Glycosyl transferase n=1 Tax=Thermodesulfovibrio yellowstonii TaxID=28262 RepID=A0A9W6GC30_9BACT|nr:sugar transferase [Thermodesulfovibrio islandicus]GLI52419.1 glycosyl transferase [Thermodesulfovibrio islandicus]